MSTFAASRRSSSSAASKRPAMDENAAGGPRWTRPQATKRVALGNITNVAAPAPGRRAAVGKVAPPATTRAVRTPPLLVRVSGTGIVSAIGKFHAERNSFRFSRAQDSCLGSMVLNPRGVGVAFLALLDPS